MAKSTTILNTVIQWQGQNMFQLRKDIPYLILLDKLQGVSTSQRVDNIKWQHHALAEVLRVPTCGVGSSSRLRVSSSWVPSSSSHISGILVTSDVNPGIILSICQSSTILNFKLRLHQYVFLGAFLWWLILNIPMVLLSKSQITFFFNHILNYMALFIYACA